MSDSKSCQFFNFDEADNFLFKKRQIRKKFNCDENREIIKEQMEVMNNAYLKLTTSYEKNNIFGIIRHGNFFYDASLKNLDYLYDTLKEHYNKIPKDSYDLLSKFATSISDFTDHLFKAKDDWAQQFSKGNDPDFDEIIQKSEEKFTAIIANLDKIEKLENLLYCSELSTTSSVRKNNRGV